jgi:tRNA 2-thiocytidine biosynthesis protein TtcA
MPDNENQRATDGRESNMAGRQAFFLLKQINRAVREFAMIQSGDRVAVAVSGGKDSLSLLRLLQLRQQTDPTRYELAAVHVRGDATGVTAPYAPLGDWLTGQGMPFAIVEPEIGTSEAIPLNCQRCAWLRRKALFTAAAVLGCNVVAYAHHADDAAQTTLLNLLYTGNSRTLRPSAAYFGGQFRLIRPLFYTPESELARFARVSAFPAPPPLCPRADHSRRLLVRKMLEMTGRDYLLQIRENLIRAGLAANEDEATT